MENVISLSMSDIINAVVKICGCITATAAAIAVIVKLVNHWKAPDKLQNERIKKLEDTTVEHSKYLSADRKRLDGIDAERRLVMRALLALLSHGIDGNDIKSMQDVKAELTTLLINK